MTSRSSRQTANLLEIASARTRSDLPCDGYRMRSNAAIDHRSSPSVCAIIYIAKASRVSNWNSYTYPPYRNRHVHPCYLILSKPSRTPAPRQRTRVGFVNARCRPHTDRVHTHICTTPRYASNDPVRGQDCLLLRRTEFVAFQKNQPK